MPTPLSLSETRQTQLAFAGLVLLLSLAVCLYAAPRFAEALQSLKLRQTAARLSDDDSAVTQEQLQAVMAAVDALPLERVPADQRAEAGYLALRGALAVRGQQPALYRQRLGQAEAALTAALRERPADSYSWARLALVRLELGQPLTRVAEAWRLSVAAAPFEPQLLPWRLGVALAVYGQLDAADRDLVARQTVASWQASQWRTARVLAVYRRPEILRPFLQNRPAEEQATFDKSYAWFAAKGPGAVQRGP